MKITFADLRESRTTASKDETLILLVGVDKKFSALFKTLDSKAGGLLSRAVMASKFQGKKGQYLAIPAPASLGCTRVVLAGAGDAAKMDKLIAQGIGGGLVPYLNNLGAKTATLLVELAGSKGFSAEQAAAYMAYGARLRSYRFDKYHTKMKPEDKPTLGTLAVQVKNGKAASAAFIELEHIAEGVFLTRNLVSEPANIIYPKTFAEAALALKRDGLEVEVLGEEQMKTLGMGSLLGVGQGSVKESKMVVMRWNGLGKKSKTAPVAFVGKGVCFDTGGISIKPAGGMEEMKWDMAGAGAVIGVMRALALRNAKVNAVGVCGLVENMPDGNAQRPGDVVTSMSGQTIEVLNTDAEGRLVLADALWYTQVNYKPACIIDLATLTGAIIVALGTSRAGLFSNNDKLARQLADAGLAVNEPLWQLPLGDEYDKQINSDIADMQNIGKDREAGSITAAQFLQRFIKDNTPWAHLDIAGTAWSKKDSDICPKGATAFGVRLLDQFVRENYEE